MNQNKVILLTGASGGLGTAMSEHLHQLGYTLALHFHDNAPSLAESEHVQHFQADLRNVDEIEAMVEAVRGVFGRIDMIINNAGISRNGMSWKLDFEDWDDSIAVNLTAPFYVSKCAIPFMRENSWGRIINISSVVGQTGFIGTSAYAASKAGLLGLTKTLSKELAAFNITVNNFALGYFDQGMIHDVPEEMQQELIQQIPMNRLGDVQSIFAALDFVLNENSGYFTGQSLNINGGLY